MKPNSYKIISKIKDVNFLVEKKTKTTLPERKKNRQI